MKRKQGAARGGVDPCISSSSPIVLSGVALVGEGVTVRRRPFGDLRIGPFVPGPQVPAAVAEVDLRQRQHCEPEIQLLSFFGVRHDDIGTRADTQFRDYLRRHGVPTVVGQNHGNTLNFRDGQGLLLWYCFFFQDTSYFYVFLPSLLRFLAGGHPSKKVPR